MVKVNGVVKAIGLACVVVLIGGADDGCKTKKEKTEEAEKLPAVDVTAKQLFADYKSNEVNADSKYRNRILRVSGKVTKIAKDMMDDPLVELATSNQFESVDAHFEKDGALGSLQRGQQVTVRCRGNNVIMGSPQLADCTLE